ncbi:MAG: hypothetical protein RBJ76_28890 [Stenomitos frigidus ULC029]
MLADVSCMFHQAQSKNSDRHRPRASSTQLVGLTLQLQPLQDATLYPQHAIGLHAWLLDQVRQLDPTLSAYLHDGESEKLFIPIP